MVIDDQRKYRRFNRSTNEYDYLTAMDTSSFAGWCSYNSYRLNLIVIDDLIPFFLGRQNKIYVYSHRYGRTIPSDVIGVTTFYGTIMIPEIELDLIYRDYS